MSKNKYQGHPPRPSKGTLHKAAQEQHKRDEERLTLATVDKGEVTATDVAVITAAVAGDQQGAAELVVKELAQGPAAADGTATPEATPAPAAKPTKTEATLYALGKKYVPKTDRNSGTWAILTKALGEGPKTMKELAELVKTHKDFLGYMTRGGHIIPYVAKEVAAEQAAAN